MNWLEIIGCLTGLLYLWLEYRASIYLWPVSIIMPAIYLAVYYEAGLYADFGINVYFLLASAYGWLAWRRGKKDSGSNASGNIRRFPVRLIPAAAAALVACHLLIAWILIRFTDSTVPWLDSFTTAASIIAMWMLARKYAEQWLVWIAVDLVSCGLYVYKELYFTAALYLLYSVIAVAGYRNWLRSASAS